jgi:hypothetical protein
MKKIAFALFFCGSTLHFAAAQNQAQPVAVNPQNAKNTPTIMGYRLTKTSVIFEFLPSQYDFTTNGDTGDLTKITDLALKTVTVAGEMNEWKTAAAEWQLALDAKTGIYTLTVPLANLVGNLANLPKKTWQFKFVINGNEWVMLTKNTANAAQEAGKDFRYANLVLAL